MRNDTRLHSTPSPTRSPSSTAWSRPPPQFTVNPTVQQTLGNPHPGVQRLPGPINIIGVNEQKGAEGRPGRERHHRRPHRHHGRQRASDRANVADLTGQQLQRTPRPTSTPRIPYALLDAWARFPDFQARLRDAIIKRQALDRIMIGFNGTSARGQHRPRHQSAAAGRQHGLAAAVPHQGPGPRAGRTPPPATGKVTVGAAATTRTSTPWSSTRSPA